MLARGNRHRGVCFVKGLNRFSKESASTCKNQKHVWILKSVGPRNSRPPAGDLQYLAHLWPSQRRPLSCFWAPCFDHVLINRRSRQIHMHAKTKHNSFASSDSNNVTLIGTLLNLANYHIANSCNSPRYTLSCTCFQDQIITESYAVHRCTHSQIPTLSIPSSTSS